MIKEWYQQIKHNSNCADCGISGYPHSWLLEFHHLDSSEKKMAVHSMVHDGYSQKKIQAEMDKCVVLCANCHRIRHQKEYTRQSQKTQF